MFKKWDDENGNIHCDIIIFNANKKYYDIVEKFYISTIVNENDVDQFINASQMLITIPPPKMNENLILTKYEGFILLNVGDEISRTYVEGSEFNIMKYINFINFDICSEFVYSKKTMSVWMKYAKDKINPVCLEMSDINDSDQYNIEELYKIWLERTIIRVSINDKFYDVTENLNTINTINTIKQAIDNLSNIFIYMSGNNTPCPIIEFISKDKLIKERGVLMCGGTHFMEYDKNTINKIEGRDKLIWDKFIKIIQK